MSTPSSSEQEMRLAHIRHELRTPINAIMGYAEMMLEDCADVGLAEISEDLERIQKAGQELLKQVNQLSGKQTIDRLIEEPAEFESKLRIALRTPLNDVLGYSQLLLEDISDPGYREDLQRIETSAQRLFSTLDRIVKLARGHEPNSAPNTPPKTPSILDDALNSFNQHTPQPQRRTTGKVLLADDSDTNRDLIGRMLRREGHQVIEALDGEAALRMLDEHKVDVILLDIVMPGLNGYEVLSRIKSDPHLRHLPVIMISALDHMESIIKCVELGADDYLPKPCHQTLLRARVTHSLERKLLRDQEQGYVKVIEDEKKRSDQLLHAIFPHQIVEELKETQTIKSRRRENVAVLFSDIVGFTSFCEGKEPEEVISTLQKVMVAYEGAAEKHSLQKIKTIGDAFMGAAGLLVPSANPVLDCVRCGLDMVKATRALDVGWDVRVGVHVGPLMTGVLGQRQYLFDLFGDTVNTASRMESNSLAGKITLSRDAWTRIEDVATHDSVTKIPIKGKGTMELVRFGSFKEVKQ